MGKRTLYKLIFFAGYPLVDFIFIALAIIFSYKFYRVIGIGQHVYYHKIHIVPVSLLSAFVTTAVMWGSGVYKNESSLLNLEEIKNVVKGITLSFLILGIILVFQKINVSRYVLFFSYFFSLIFVVIEKMIFYHVSSFKKPINGIYKKILIYGAGELGLALFREIANSPKLRIVPVGFIDDDLGKSDLAYYQSGFNSSECLKVVGTRKDIKRLIKELDVDEIFIAISNIKNDDLIEILEYFRTENIKASFVPNLYKVFIHNVKINKIGEIPIIKENDDSEPAYLRFKRYLDLFLAPLALILFWPLFLVIVLAIKIDSKGPVIFVHDRIGKDGKIFRLFKFRTMHMNEDPYAINPINQNDTRITKVGRFLRKTSLDEIPQIFNVLKGEMSFVGPRPEMPFIVEQYDEIHKERLKVLPGITGLWQLSGDRKKAIHENMDYDLYYKRHVSFFLDLAILIETAIFAFKGI